MTCTYDCGTKINPEIPSGYCAGIPYLQAAEIFGGGDFKLGTFFL